MLGAIYGDIVGSRFEFTGFDEYKFEMFHPSCRFTDDTLMTLAVGLTLVETKGDRDTYQKQLVKNMSEIANMYPRQIGWGQKFYKWLFDYKISVPINSCGNGAGMRISPVGWFCDTLEETIELSKLTTEVSHDHPEGIKGAESVAVAIFLARTGKSKEEIREKMISYYPEIKDMTVAKYKANGYGLDENGHCITCQGSIPQAICAFLDSENFEDAIRKAITLGADSDTQACITGSIAEAYYGLTYDDEDKVFAYLPVELQRMYLAFCSIKKKRIKREI